MSYIRIQNQIALEFHLQYRASYQLVGVHRASVRYRSKKSDDAQLVSNCINKCAYFAHLFQHSFALALDNLSKLPSRSALCCAEKSEQNKRTYLCN